MLCFRALSCTTLVCLRLISQTDGRTFYFRIFCQRAEFMVSSIVASLPGPEAAKQSHTSATTFDCWNDVLFVECCVSFTPDVMGNTSSKTIDFCLVRQKNNSSELLAIIKMFFQETVRRAFVFFLVSSGFCLGTLPWVPFLPAFLFFSIFES